MKKLIDMFDTFLCSKSGIVFGWIWFTLLLTALLIETTLKLGG